MIYSPPRGLVFDIRRYSIHDGPGIRTAVFFKGCPLDCWWCHNPESQSPQAEMMFRESRCIRCGACLEACPEDAIRQKGGWPVIDDARCTLCGLCADACQTEARERVGREVTVAEVVAEARRDLAFYEESGGGVTLSGGEPLAQREFALALLQACQAEGLHTALDTCGHTPWEALDRAREHVDMFLYDLKLMDDARHLQLTGVSNALILGNAQALARRGHAMRLRVPVITGINDDTINIRQIGEFASALPGRPEVDLLPYHLAALDKYARLGRPYRLPAAQAPSEARLEEITRILEGYGLRVSTGG
jgi:pyruvate formate lyase activating enzyme